MLYKPYSNLDWIMVPNIDAVDTVSVQPSQKAWVMVQNEPIFALRMADPMGLVSTEFYKFEKYEKPRSEFITASELEKVLEKLKGDINESISKLTDGANSASNNSNDKAINAIA